MAENREDKRKLLNDAWESYKKDYEQDSFNWIKERYEEVRESQRKNIKKFLKEKGFTVINKGREGRGGEEYGESRLGESYDLSNWKWIDVEKNGKKILLSLQPFDYDEDNGNYHALMDRLGIYLYKKNNGKTSDAIKRMFITDIDLPMNTTNFEKLEYYLGEIFRYWGKIEAYEQGKKDIEKEIIKESKKEYEEEYRKEHGKEYGEVYEEPKLYITVGEKKTLFEQISDIVKEGK